MLQRTLIDVCSLVSGTSAIPAATGFRSMYAAMARRASSSRIATLLKRPSKNAPRTLSCLLASRDNGSFRHFMNQLMLCNRSRAVATHPGILEPPLNPIIRNGKRLS